MIESSLVRQRIGAMVELALTRFRLFYREPGAMFWTFGFPIAITLVLGIAFRTRKPEPVVVAVETSFEAPAEGLEARSARAVELLERRADVKVRRLDHVAARNALRTGQVSLVVVPTEHGYAYRFDEARDESRFARVVADDALQRGEGRADAFVPDVHPVTEPGSRYIDFLVPGLLGLGLMSTGLWGIGFALAEMRTKKLLKRLLATPMRRSDFLISFLFVRAVLLLAELPPLLVFAKFAFDVGIRGSVWTLGLVALAGGLTFTAMGLLLASRAEHASVVSGLINAVSFPMYLCSGVFFPASRFPEALLPVLRLLPLTALNDAMRAVMIEGASVVDVGRPLLVLVVWGSASFVLALRFFKWR